MEDNDVIIIIYCNDEGDKERRVNIFTPQAQFFLVNLVTTIGSHYKIKVVTK